MFQQCEQGEAGWKQVEPTLNKKCQAGTLRFGTIPKNFFRCMMQHHAIDLLNGYGTAEIPVTKRP